MSEQTSTSWWADRALQADRAAFAERVATELPRMQTSKGAVYADTYHAAMAGARSGALMGYYWKGQR